MKELYVEGVANHDGPGHAVASATTRSKRWIRGTCRHGIEPRNCNKPGADVVNFTEGNISPPGRANRPQSRGAATRRTASRGDEGPAGSETRACMEISCARTGRSHR